jgi:hypothetical protein
VAALSEGTYAPRRRRLVDSMCSSELGPLKVAVVDDPSLRVARIVIEC